MRTSGRVCASRRARTFELSLESESFKHRASSHDLCAAVLCEGKYTATVAGDEVIGLARLCHRQKKMIGRTPCAIHMRQSLDYQGFRS